MKGAEVKRAPVIASLWMAALCLGASPSLSAAPQTTEGLQLTGVSVSPNTISPQENESATIRFNLSRAASVALEIYDAYDQRTWHAASQQPLAAGDHAMPWPGVDDAGKPVAPGAYYYVLKASSSDGSAVTHDLTDVTGGKNVKVERIRFLPEEGLIEYAVPETAFLFVRYGIEDHVLLGTLVNAKVHTPGQYRVPWNGYDASGRIKLAGHPEVGFFAHGMNLSRNAIVVKGPQPEASPPLADQAVIRAAALKPIGLNAHAYHKRHLCRDFGVTLDLIDAAQADKGAPLVSGRTRFRVDVAPEDQAVVQNQRFEIQFYLDNQMIYENEVSYTPYNWTLDMSAIPPGTHHLTALVVGYGAHFGVSTLELRVK
ncbi:MAG: hypothetical protein J5I92_01545 [Thiogranum sp.]|nr:hypothetical protein [Thiogranum sp.]